MTAQRTLSHVFVKLVVHEEYFVEEAKVSVVEVGSSFSFSNSSPMSFKVSVRISTTEIGGSIFSTESTRLLRTSTPQLIKSTALLKVFIIPDIRLLLFRDVFWHSGMEGGLVSN